MHNKQIHGKVVLLIGKVACGKTTYARKMEAHGGAIFLSLDELQLDIFGENPTREQLDSTYSGCNEYQKRLALKLVNNGLDVYLDWGFWEQSSRDEVLNYFEKEQIKVHQYYFDVPLEVRHERNRKRNQGNDNHSFKIEEKDVAFFDGFFEEPVINKNDRVIVI